MYRLFEKETVLLFSPNSKLAFFSIRRKETDIPRMAILNYSQVAGRSRGIVVNIVRGRRSTCPVSSA